jgi:hypothetical protein
MGRERPRTHAGALRSLRRKVHIMGKYVLAWLLGVPAFVLVLIYFFF